MEASFWDGTVCMTGSGRYAAASFGPAEFHNHPELKDRGAFGAVIDLGTGQVTTLRERVALKYHTPGCGPKDEIVFLRHLGVDQEATELLLVNPSSPTDITKVRWAGQLTSPAPQGDSIFAAAGNSIVRLDRTGRWSRVASSASAPFQLHANGSGGLDFLTVEANETVGKRWTGGKVLDLARAPVGKLAWAPGRAGKNRLVGAPAWVAKSEQIITFDGKPAGVALDGSLVVESVAMPDDSGDTHQSDHDDSAGEFVVRARAAGGGQVELAQVPMGAGTQGAQLALANTTTPKCAVPRNDYTVQVMQPSSAQVEWAANLAVKDQLTITRPANWNNNGLSAYKIQQGIFPRTALSGGGTVPVQVLLGILAQESNLWQASRGALPGIPGNPIIGNYYGTVYDKQGRIVGMDYTNADCGYGVAQVTDGMTAISTARTATQKKAIATDYAANVAAGLNILIDKWNQAKAQGLIANSGSPSKVENWYFAIWAYNTGLYAPNGSNPYGVGWTNNPANADYPPDRLGFLRASYGDAATPGKWPYQERVLGWAERALIDTQVRPAYTPTATKLELPVDPVTGVVNRFMLCVPSVNQCDPTYIDQADATKSYCTRSDRKCWWHGSISWGSIGTDEVTAYSSGAPEPAAPTNPHPPSCSPGASGNPTYAPLAGAVIVDDIPSTTWNLVGCPAAASPGSFTFTYGQDASGAPLSAIDLHQIGGGYGGHFWYAHTNTLARPSHTVTGEWTPPATSSGWQRILVHIPDHGADTNQANYRIWNGVKWYHRIVNQRWNQNTWIDLGIFNLGAGSKVVLSNETWDDYFIVPSRAIDIAWDAIAFVPSAKPAVSYVAFGDSYSAGEGVEPYWPDSDIGAKTSGFVNKCHRSMSNYPEVLNTYLRGSLGGPGTYHVAACSGARMADVNGGQTHHGEAPQLNQGWLDENTTHVTISISGNDAGFADIIKGCILTVTACTDPSYRLKRDGVVDPEPLITYEPQVIDNLEPYIAQLLADIAYLAPNAEVVLVGYPRVVSTQILRGGLGCGLLDQLTVEWFADMTDRLAQVTESAAQTAGVRFLDPSAHFSGHEACTTGTEWINALVAWSETGSGRDVPGSGSFHPKFSGQQQYATLARGLLLGP